MARVVLFSMFFLCFQAHGYHFCKGTVKDVWVDYYGTLFINGSWRNGHTRMCHINSEWEGVSTDVCKTWLSLATTAQVSQGNVIVRYSDSDITGCDNIPKYNDSPRPHYIMLDRQ